MTALADPEVRRFAKAVAVEVANPITVRHEHLPFDAIPAASARFLDYAGRLEESA